jgi:hypothetical protein
MGIDSHLKSTKTLKNSMFDKHFSQVSLKVMMITLVVAGIFASIGYALGGFLGNRLFFVIAGVLVSYPISLFLVYKTFTRKIKN